MKTSKCFFDRGDYVRFDEGFAIDMSTKPRKEDRQDFIDRIMGLYNTLDYVHWKDRETYLAIRGILDKHEYKFRYHISDQSTGIIYMASDNLAALVDYAKKYLRSVNVESNMYNASISID